MTRRSAHLIGWTLIAAVTGLLFVLDHFRMLLSYFNWFMAILLTLSVLLVGAALFLARRGADAGGGRRASTVEGLAAGEDRR